MIKYTKETSPACNARFGVRTSILLKVKIHLPATNSSSESTLIHYGLLADYIIRIDSRIYDQDMTISTCLDNGEKM